MKARSRSYPSKTLLDAEKFSISVFQNVGETNLKYSDLAKHGDVPVREADAFAVTAGQYGWMNKSHGKGYSAIPSICTALRTPHDDEEKSKLYLQAFQYPQLYKSLITELNGKKITEEGLKINLIRNHGFTDSGANVAAKVFIDNAKILSLINTEDIFNIDADIVIDLSAVKEKQPKSVKVSPIINQKDTAKPKVQNQNTTLPASAIGGSLKKISVFVRGIELGFQIPEDMNQGDWDAVIKQLQNIKLFSK